MRSGLRSFEACLAGYTQEAPGSQEEEELLSQLLGVCFGSSSGEAHDELLADVVALGASQAQCELASVPEPQMQAIRDTVVQAVRGLKHKVTGSVSSQPCLCQIWVVNLLSGLAGGLTGPGRTRA